MTIQRTTPPGKYPAARELQASIESALDGIRAFTVLALGGHDGEPHLLAHGSRQESPNGMGLPEWPQAPADYWVIGG